MHFESVKRINMAAGGGLPKAVEKTVVEAAKDLEDELDAEIDKLGNMDADELDKLRYSIL